MKRNLHIKIQSQILEMKQMLQSVRKYLKMMKVDAITVQLSYYQAQVEYAYDLLRRIQCELIQNIFTYQLSVHTYKFVEYSFQQLQTWQKDQTLYQKYLDKIMKGFISNVQEIATEKIKEFCASGLIKNNTFIESGKSFFKQFIFNGRTIMAKVSNFNFGLLKGGIIAEQIVSKVAQNVMINRISCKLDLLQLELNQMANELTYINSDMDHLIYRVGELYPNNFEQNKTCNQI